MQVMSTATYGHMLMVGQTLYAMPQILGGYIKQEVEICEHPACCPNDKGLTLHV